MLQGVPVFPTTNFPPCSTHLLTHAFTLSFEGPNPPLECDAQAPLSRRDPHQQTPPPGHSRSVATPSFTVSLEGSEGRVVPDYTHTGATFAFLASPLPDWP